MSSECGLSGKSGPCEYLIACLRPSLDVPNEVTFCLPGEVEFEACWKRVVDHSFPRVSLLSNRSRLALFAQLGEYHFLCEDLIESGYRDIVLIPVPRTLYELVALVLHATDRVSTPFAPLDAASAAMTFLEPFCFDHKTTVQKVTAALLLKRTTAALDQESLWKSAFNVNWLLLACVLQTSGKVQNPTPIHSIMDLELDMTSFTTDRQSISYWISEIKVEFWGGLAEILLDDLAACARGQDTDLSRQYDLWPLTSPYLPARLQDIGAESPTVIAKFRTLESHLWALSDAVLQFQPDSLLEANRILDLIRQECIQDEEGIYGGLCGAFCPELLEISEIPQRFSEAKRFAALLDIYRRADPFISAIRDPRFLLERHIITNVIREEMRPNEMHDLFFAFRGTVNMNHESLSTLEHTISPEQYGMELGSSSNYKECHSNPCKAHSMSFGSSLFAGMLYDPTASVWMYWSSSKINCGYIVQLPIDLHLLERLNQEFVISSSKEVDSRHNGCEHVDTPSDEPLSPTCPNAITEPKAISDWFYIPPLCSLLGLAGSGELWHVRTKCNIPPAFREQTFAFITGMLNCAYRRVPDFLVLDAQPPKMSELPVLTMVNRTLGPASLI